VAIRALLLTGKDGSAKAPVKSERGRHQEEIFGEWIRGGTLKTHKSGREDPRGYYEDEVGIGQQEVP
jgi:hypothetical protein